MKLYFVFKKKKKKIENKFYALIQTLELKTRLFVILRKK